MRPTLLLPLILFVACSAPEMDTGRFSGKWQRTDGTYRLEITVDEKGAPVVYYFNPGPIHVEKAAFVDSAERPGAKRLRVELNDRGYPGATYDLEVNPDDGSLTGIYYNPNAGRPFPVRFVPGRE